MVRDVARDRTRGATRANLQRARLDCRGARVGVGRGENRPTAAALHHAARPAHDTGEREIVGAIEGQRALVDHVARQAA